MKSEGSTEYAVDDTALPTAAREGRRCTIALHDPIGRRPAADRLRRTFPGSGIVTMVALAFVVGFVAQACGSVGRGMNHHDAMHGGGRDSRSEQAVVAAGTVTVEIRDYAFSPGNLRVTAGTTVTFVNRDDVIHTATDDGGTWDSGLLGTDRSSAIVFSTPGEYDYRCLPHPSMRGRITVTPG